MAEVANISHASDLATDWTGTLTVDGGDLSWKSAAGMGGTSGGMSALIDDATAIYGQNTGYTAGTAAERLRFYFKDVSLTMASGDEFDIFWVHTSGTTLLKVELRNDSGTKNIRFYALHDGPGYDTITVAIPAQGTEAVYEVRVVRAATNVSADGAFYVYQDGDYGTPVGSVTSIDNYDNFTNATMLRAGAITGIDAGTSGEFYLDEIVLRNDDTQIGVLATPPTITGPGNNTLGAHGAAEAIPCTVVVTDGSTATMRLQCTSGKGTVDLADLDSGVTATAGTRGTNDVTFSGTPAQINNAALDIEYTGAGDSEKLTDTAVVVTIDDGVNSPVSDTFTVTTVRNTIEGTQAQINAALATLAVTIATSDPITMELFTRDSIGTDTDTSILTILSVFDSGSGATFRGKRRRRRHKKS